MIFFQHWKDCGIASMHNKRDESVTFNSVKRALLDCVLIVAHTFFFLLFVLFALHSVAKKALGDKGGWRLIIFKKIYPICPKVYLILSRVSRIRELYWSNSKVIKKDITGSIWHSSNGIQKGIRRGKSCLRTAASFYGFTGKDREVRN